jgi:hypothetical protein
MNDLFAESTDIKIGFESETIELPTDQILPIKPVPTDIEKSKKFKQILASIKEVGIIEPVVISPESRGKYILLDGHLRLIVLKKLKVDKVICIISKDDEAYTYNKFINRLAPIQEHKMIRKAIERGVSEAQIARALNVDVQSIVRKKTMLDGLCPEVLEMLKDKIVSVSVFSILKKMIPYRQIEVATMMGDSATYTLPYAKAFLAATPRDQLTNPSKPKKIKGLNEEQMARMESEMDSLHREYKIIEENYSNDVLNLTLAKGYLGSLMDNAATVRYLSRNHPEILQEFQKIIEIQSLG